MSKLKQCKVCSKEIAASAKTCPSCGAKNKKPIYKRVWFWVLGLIIIIAAASGNSSDSTKTTDKTSDKEVTTTVENTTQVETAKTEEPKKESVPTEYKSALKKAESYSNTLHMSKAKLYDQLTSEYGEKFSAEAAQYAMDNIQADWNANALKKAESYQETMSMSPSKIYDQLTSEHGEKFTAEEAQYAIDNLK